MVEMVREQTYDTLGPHLVYTGTSGDVANVAWSPDNYHFVAGSTAVTDSSSMQYNGRNNLLLGDMASRSIKELPEHCIERIRPPSGPNSLQAMHSSQDPNIWTTVSAVKFSPDGRFMFTAGYDQMARGYDMSDVEATKPRWALKHKAQIDLLTIHDNSSTIATGSRRISQAIKVIQCNDSHVVVKASFTSPRAPAIPEAELYPTSLQWGTSWYSHMLLAGFTAHCSQNGLGETLGDTCLWDLTNEKPIALTQHAKGVFDCVWNRYPKWSPGFAVATVAGANVNRGTRSVVRLFSPSDASLRHFKHICELECPARDINDALFCPYDDQLISASCTDGMTYVWDVRRPDLILHKLAHGESLHPLNHEQLREEADTGVRFASYGHSSARFYTGSSDGVVKAWDLRRSTEDVWVKDIIKCRSGIMSGAFSPDFSNLLLGEVNGTISVLTVGQEDKTLKDMEPLHFKPAERPVAQQYSGIEEARHLLHTNQVQFRRFGLFPRGQVVQGEAYDGPYSTAADAPELRAKAEAFQRRFTRHTSCELDYQSGIHLPFMTEEEVGEDKGYWRWRIPHAMRYPLAQALPSGTGPPRECLSCKRLFPNTRGESASVCPLCLFTCTRCGSQTMTVPVQTSSGHEGDTSIKKSTLDPTFVYSGSCNLPTQDSFTSGLAADGDDLRCSKCSWQGRLDILGFSSLDVKVEGSQDVFKIQEVHDGVDPATVNDEEELEEDNDLQWLYHSRWDASWSR